MGGRGRGGGRSAERPEAPRAAPRPRGLGEEEEGRELKEQGSPSPTPPCLPGTPHAVKGLDSRASPLAGIICPPERKYAPHNLPPPFHAPPPLSLWGPRTICACVPRPARSARPRLPEHPPHPTPPHLPAPLRAPARPARPAPPPPSARAPRELRSLHGHLLRREEASLPPSCAEPAPPGASDLRVACRALGRCGPRVHPLLGMGTVPRAALPDFSERFEAGVCCRPPDLKREFHVPPGQRSQLASLQSSYLNSSPSMSSIPTSCQGHPFALWETDAPPPCN